MDTHYNAFISYRHHPLDIKVATQIHRALERFHVPKAIRNKAKLPMRLFRDKDELPITSNLSDDIFDALRNSDYLIVICSTHTKESMWVQREIETFLKFHHRSKVLTVLVDGEPYEVIPEILLSEQITDPATGTVTTVPVEPLSCDWRIGRRKAIREELPRLAAPLLHCSYDELRQRQRQYRMRRLIAFFSAALAASLCLTAYFLYTSITIRNANIQIQTNLDQSLKNQSQYLASASQLQLESNNRLTAIALAMAGLPGDGNPRPYVPGAELALSEALGVYSVENTMAATGAMIPSSVSTVNAFAVSDDQTVIYVKDSRDVITIWNPQTMEKIGSIEFDSYFSGKLEITNTGNLLTVHRPESEYFLLCYGPDGNIVWQKAGLVDFVFLENKSVVIALEWKDRQYRVLYLDPDTGREIRDAIPLSGFNDLVVNLGFYPQDYTDGMPLILNHSNYPFHEIICMDGNGQMLDLFTSEEPVNCIRVLEDGRIVCMVSDGSGYYNGNYGNYIITSPSRSVLQCYSADGKVLWESEISTHIYTSNYNIQPIPGSDRFLCQAGNTLQVHDSASGAILSTCEAESGVKFLNAQDTFGFGILQDGKLLHYSYEENECNAYDYNLEGNLRQVYMENGFCFTLQIGSSQVTAYKYLEPPVAWSDESEGSVYARYYRYHGDQLAILSSEKLYMYNLREHRYVWTEELPYGNTLLGFIENGSKLLLQNENYEPVVYDCATGESSILSVTDANGNPMSQIPYHPDLFADRIWSCDLVGSNCVLCWTDLSTGVTSSTPYLEFRDVNPNKAEEYYAYLEMFDTLSREEQESRMNELYAVISSMSDCMFEFLGDGIIYANGQYAWFLDGKSSLIEVELESGAVRKLQEELPVSPRLFHREADGLTAVGWEDQITLHYPGSESHLQIQLEDERVGSLYIHEETLFVLCESGCILRYDLLGTLLTRTELMVSNSFVSKLFSDNPSPTDISWVFKDDGTLIFTAYNVANIIDCSTWELRGYLVDCLFYHRETDCFPRSGDSGLYAFPCYSTEDLLLLGQETLGNFHLTPEQKNTYGLN